MARATDQSSSESLLASQPELQRARGRRPDWLHWPRFSQNVWLLLIYTLGKGFQISIGAVTINLYVYSLGYRQDFVGLFAGMSSLGALVMAIPAGMISDRLGRKQVMVLSGLLTPLTLVATAFSTSESALLLSSFVNGIVASFYWVTCIPMLAESVQEDQRVGVLAMNSFLLLGLGAMGSLIGGLVPEVAATLLHQSSATPEPLRLGILAASVVVLLAALPLFWLRVPAKKLPSEEAKIVPAAGDIAIAAAAVPQRNEERRKKRITISRPLLVLFAMLLIPDLLITFGEGIVVGLLQLFFFLKFGLRPGTLGGLFALAGFIGGLAGLCAPLLVKRWGKLRTTTSLQLVTGPVMLLTGFAPWLVLSASGEYIRTMLRAFIEPVYAAFALEQMPEQHRATLFGFYSVTWGLGYSLGPSLGGWLQVHVGLSAGFVVGAICLTAAPVLLLSFFGRRDKQAGL
ncbi:MAG TPA: MFS transporter [Ktedonobacterales bacterium]